MDFAPSARALELIDRVSAFVEEHVYPVEEQALRAWDEEVRPGVGYPDFLVELRERAKADGLWNLFLPDERFGPGLSNAEYGMVCEIMGRSIISPMVFNCSAPDTGNMEILAEYGTPEQQERWLAPMLEQHSRSAYSMTEPDTAGSDPTGLRTRAELVNGEWVIHGHKWFTSGAVGADFAIAMVVTDPDAAPHSRASMIIVPIDAPGLEIVRSVSFMGESGNSGHCEIRYDQCRVPESNLLGGRGEGFAIGQARLGPGRIHHCMRMIGVAERALEYMCRRATSRSAFGGILAEKQFVQDFVAKSRMEIDATRLMVLHAAWKMDTHGKREARQEISMIKVAAAQMVMRVLDRSIQVLGALGMTDDTPIARLWREQRALRLADGADEVHKMVIARRELNRWADQPMTFPAQQRAEETYARVSVPS
jgi:acyl-CoA dehydrogenase